MISPVYLSFILYLSFSLLFIPIHSFSNSFSCVIFPHPIAHTWLQAIFLVSQIFLDELARYQLSRILIPLFSSTFLFCLFYIIPKLFLSVSHYNSTKPTGSKCLSLLIVPYVNPGVVSSFEALTRHKFYILKTSRCCFIMKFSCLVIKSTKQVVINRQQLRKIQTTCDVLSCTCLLSVYRFFTRWWCPVHIHKVRWLNSRENYAKMKITLESHFNRYFLSELYQNILKY